MKYTTNNLKEAQFVGGVKLDPNGGEVTDTQAKAIAADPWGKKLMESKKIVFEKTVAVPTKPQLGMSVKGSIDSIKGTNIEKTPVPASGKKSGK